MHTKESYCNGIDNAALLVLKIIDRFVARKYMFGADVLFASVATECDVTLLCSSSVRRLTVSKKEKG